MTLFFYFLEIAVAAAAAYLGARSGSTKAAESNFTSLQGHLMDQDTHLQKLTDDINALGTQLTTLQTAVATNNSTLAGQISDQAKQIQTLKDELTAAGASTPAIDAALDGLDANVLALATTASAIGAAVTPAPASIVTPAPTTAAP